MWNVLSNALASEDALLGGRITGTALQKMYNNGYAAMETHNAKIVAFATLWETEDPKWHELGSVWVCKSRRNHGLGSKVFVDCVNLLSSNVFLITHNPKIVHLAQKAGMAEASTKTWPSVPFAVSCKPCDRVHCKKACPLRATDSCRLFFK